jgi:hypothetical protein
MFLITSFVFFLFKPLTTQPKLATSEKTAYTSVSLATGFGLSLVLILQSDRFKHGKNLNAKKVEICLI